MPPKGHIQKTGIYAAASLNKQGSGSCPTHFVLIGALTLPRLFFPVFFICFTILISFNRHTHLKQVHQSLRRHLFPFLITVFFIKLDSTTKSELEAATRYDQTPASSQ